MQKAKKERPPVIIDIHGRLAFPVAFIAECYARGLGEHARIYLSLKAYDRNHRHGIGHLPLEEAIDALYAFAKGRLSKRTLRKHLTQPSPFWTLEDKGWDSLLYLKQWKKAIAIGGSYKEDPIVVPISSFWVSRTAHLAIANLGAAYLASLGRMGSQRKSRRALAARLWGVDERTTRRWEASLKPFFNALNTRPEALAWFDSSVMFSLFRHNPLREDENTTREYLHGRNHLNKWVCSKQMPLHPMVLPRARALGRRLRKTRDRSPSPEAFGPIYRDRARVDKSEVIEVHLTWCGAPSTHQNIDPTTWQWGMPRRYRQF